MRRYRRGSTQPSRAGRRPWQVAAMWLLLTLLVAVLGARTAQAQSADALPAGFAVTRVAGGLTTPTQMVIAPDGRIFVCEKAGKVRIIKNGALLATPFVTITVDSYVERGLIGITLDPSFTQNNWVYVHYTSPTPQPHNRISRFTANGDVAVPGSETIIFELENLNDNGHHNGGAIHFGTDGKLYIGTGDNTRNTIVQSTTNLLGKFLRINKDGTIPSDNPYFNSASGRNRAIWAVGLRNPFTFAVQPGTGRIYVNDVGQAAWEEVNEIVKAGNYGWPDTEGYTNDPRFDSPIHAYPHGTGPGQGFAIVGGVFYNPAQQQFPPDFVGKYLFSDYSAGWIRRLDPVTKQTSDFATLDLLPVDLDVGADGSLYVLASKTSSVERIRYTGNQQPSIATHPESKTVTVGQPVTFAVTANGTLPLTYQWQRNGSDISGATGASYTINSVSPSDNGAQFRVIVRNSAGTATSNAATLTVTNNQAPTGTITAPGSSARYSAGETISYSGSATDPEDGTLGGARFTWRVDFHHDDHSHPFIDPHSGATSGSFAIPRTGETSANVWFRITLTVRDSGGLTHTTTRDVHPRVATVTLRTQPAGGQLALDGQPVASPHSFQGVVGMQRTIGVPSPQSIGGVSHVFSSWSDGGAVAHEIIFPSTNSTYTATLTPGGGGGSLDVYADALAGGWENWSYGASVDLGVTSPVHAGSRAIGLTITSGWGALNLHTDNAFDAAQYTHLRFAARASASGQRYRVSLADDNGQQLTPVALADHGGDPTAGQWTVYQIPLAALGASGKRITGIQIKDRTGGAQPVVWVDSLSVVGAAPVLPVYADSLTTGWANWSWSATVNFGVSSPVYQGTRALALTVTAPWGGLYLRAAAPVATGSYTHLRFAARASAAGQRYRVELRAADGRVLPVVNLGAYGGEPVVGSWRVYAIPLADLGAVGVPITGIRIKDGTGGAQPALYLDAVSLGTGTAGMETSTAGAPAPDRTETGRPHDPDAMPAGAP